MEQIESTESVQLLQSYATLFFVPTADLLVVNRTSVSVGDSRQRGPCGGVWPTQSSNPGSVFRGAIVQF